MRSDPNALAAELHELDRRFPKSLRSVAYVWYSFRYAVADSLQRRPTSEDVPGLADDYYPAFAQLTNVDRGTLERILAIAVADGEVDKFEGAHLVVLGTAAIATFLRSPKDLDKIRRGLEPWYEREPWHVGE